MLTISQQVFAGNTVAKVGVTRGKGIYAVAEQKRVVFDHDTQNIDKLFRSAKHLTWLANQTRPGILNWVRAVARCSAALKLLH